MVLNSIRVLGYSSIPRNTTGWGHWSQGDNHFSGTTQNWDSFPTFNGSADDFVTAFSGTFTPRVSGSHNFRWSNDDRGLMYVDLDGDGVFQNSERVAGYGGGANGNMNLTAGESYSIIKMAQEYGGGQSVNWFFTEPGGSEVRVNPGDPAQAGLWGSPSLLATSTLELATDSTANLQGVVLKNGNLRITGGTHLSIEQASIDPGTGGTVGLIVETPTRLTGVAGFNGNNAAVTITKSGPATLTIDRPGTGLQNADFRLTQGTLHAIGEDPFGPAGTTVTLAGGTLSLEYDVATPADVTYQYFRFTPTKLRDDAAANSVQLSEMQVFYDGSQITGATATNPGGNNPPGELPANAVDNNTGTKWLDFNKGPLVLDFGGPVTIDEYDWATANDGQARDPVRWTFEGSHNNVHWTLLDAIVGADYPTPTDRFTFVGPLATKTVSTLDLSGVTLAVDGGGTLQATAASSVALGNLSIRGGTLNVTGAPDGVTFTGGGVNPEAAAYTLNNPMDVTIDGPFDGGGATASFTKTGSGRLTLAQGTTNHGGVSVNVQQGRLVSGGPMQAANLMIGGAANADTGAHDVTISDGGQFKGGSLTIAGAGAPFALGGDNLTAGPARLTVNGGTVTVAAGGEMPNGLLYHLDAAAGVTRDAGDYVSAWADQGPAGNHFSQGNTDKQPLWLAGGINDLPVIRFDGSNDELLLNTQTGPQTLFAVTTVFTGGGLRGIWGRENGDKGIRLNDNNWYRSAGHGSDGNDFAHGHPNGVRVNGEITGAYTVGQPHIVNQFLGPSHGGWPYPVTSIGEYFGGRAYHGDVAEMLVFDRVLSDQEVRNVGGYLAAKYGISAPAWTGNIGPQPVYLPDTDVTVTADATLLADSPSTATFGNLALTGAGVNLTLDGAPGGFTFGSVAGGNSITLAGPGNTLTVTGVLDPGGDPTDPAAGVNADFLLAGNLTLDSGAAYRWEAGAAASGDWPDSVHVGGDLTLSDWTLAVVDPGRDGLIWEPLPLFLGFDSVTWDPDLVAFDFTEAPEWLVAANPDLMSVRHLTAGPRGEGLYLLVPEPSSLLLLALGVLALLLRRHRNMK